MRVTFEHRHENKSCSVCRDRLNERLKVVKVKVFQVFKSGTILQKPTGHSLIYSFIPVWRVWGDWGRQERSSSSIRTPQLLGLVLVLVLTLLALFANPITYHQGPTAGRGSSCLPATPGRRTNTTCREPPSKVSGTISPWPGRKHFRSETNTSSLHYLSRLWQHLTVLANSHPLRGGGGCVGGGENRDERLARRRKKAEK